MINTFGGLERSLEEFGAKDKEYEEDLSSYERLQNRVIDVQTVKLQQTDDKLKRAHRGIKKLLTELQALKDQIIVQDMKISGLNERIYELQTQVNNEARECRMPGKKSLF
jgi:predicted  nucleic acid-binding Zn-ribbon protein